MRGADRLIAALEAEAVDTVFGLPGGASLAIHDALHESPIRHVLVRHEAAPATPPRATPRRAGASASRS